ncbi:MAG: ATP-binding protein [Chitinophagales bacterium]
MTRINDTDNSTLKVLELKSNLNNITVIESFIEDFRCSHAIGDDVYGNMLVAITEAVNNAILHGNKSDESKRVYINLSKQKNLVTCIVKDEGRGFDYNNLPDPTSPENIENTGGRGVFLMKNLADMVIFSNDGSIVEIQFKV